MLSHQFIGFAIVALALTQVHYTDSQATVSTCKKNFSLVNDKCLLSVNNFVNWYEADRHCHFLGAGLVSVQTQAVLNQITNWMNVVSPFTLEFWTSGNSLGRKGIYYWQSTGEQAKFLSWSSGQPQPNNGDCLTLYAVSTTNKKFGEMIRNCTMNLEPYVCEHTPVKTSTRLCLKATAYENATILMN